MENYITKKRFDELNKEIKHLREIDLPEVARAKLAAAEEGDLKENTGYHAAKERMAILTTKLAELEGMTAGPRFIEDLNVKADVVTIGTTVRVKDLKTSKESSYIILGPADSDPDKNVISFQTPIARGLIRKKPGDTCSIPTPRGTLSFKILSIQKYTPA
ncbi:transcription elongation factor GreA [bacterium]|nr:transcription elongation factor GreA [bacterium]